MQVLLQVVIFQPWVTHLLQTVQTYINDSLRCGPWWIYALPICGRGKRVERTHPKPYVVGRNGVGRLLWRYHLTRPLLSLFLSAWLRTWKMPTTCIIFLARLKRDYYQFRKLEQIFGNEISRNIFHCQLMIDIYCFMYFFFFLSNAIRFSTSKIINID